ncbi:MAG: hypothetical protein KJ623_02385 [Nanoarchaeota archaeon]|nr:hypothetical protein [Nanoarchaeota archaeon]MBU0963204.1 hypothetical protein [Nanoarchaeota archaeon]
MKKLLLILLIFSIVSVSAQTNPSNLLTPEGLNIPTQQTLFNSILSNNPDLANIISTAGVIQDPTAFLTQQATQVIYNNLDTKTQNLILEASEIKGYTDKIKDLDYNLEMDNNDKGDGVIKNGILKYKTKVEEGATIHEEINEVKVAGIKAGKETEFDGRFYCDKNCAVTISDKGKHYTYTNINPDKSSFILSEDGKLQNADFEVNKQTEMFFGDRAYTVQPGTNVVYNLKTDQNNKEYYEVTVKSQKSVDFSFPNLDLNGNPTANLQNYKINGEVKFTDKGIEIKTGASIEDTKLKFVIKNNDKEDLFLTDNIKKVTGYTPNYIVANNNEFIFNARNADISIKNGNPWIIDVPEGKSLDISMGSITGNGYLDKAQQALINTQGTFKVTNCDVVKDVNEKDIVDNNICYQKTCPNNGESCVPIKLITNNGNVIDDSSYVQICGLETSSAEATGQATTQTSKNSKSTSEHTNCLNGVTKPNTPICIQRSAKGQQLEYKFINNYDNNIGTLGKKDYIYFEYDRLFGSDKKVYWRIKTIRTATGVNLENQNFIVDESIMKEKASISYVINDIVNNGMNSNCVIKNIDLSPVVTKEPTIKEEQYISTKELEKEMAPPTFAYYGENDNIFAKAYGIYSNSYTCSNTYNFATEKVSNSYECSETLGSISPDYSYIFKYGFACSPKDKDPYCKCTEDGKCVSLSWKMDIETHTGKVLVSKNCGIDSVISKDSLCHPSKTWNSESLGLK